MTHSPSTPSAHPDVVVVGDGLIGLATAVAAAEGGASVQLVGASRAGQASHAAAGMLAPSVERAAGPAHRFAIAARDAYADYVGWVTERSGRSVSLNERGILEIALEQGEAERLRAAMPEGSRWLEPAELRRLEPTLAHAAGALHHPRDGAVDNRALLLALRAIAERQPRIGITQDPVASLDWSGQRPVVRTVGGASLTGERLVLAAGAWTAGLAGLPRRIPVEPIRGQIAALAGAPLRHVVYGPGGYLVPRGERTLAGSTMERVGFDATVTPDGMEQVRRTAARICPALAGDAVLDRWAGLRPITPDGLPILGPDPERPALVYACGHSRNGILLGPLSAACVAALLLGRPLPADLTPFAPSRFPA